MRCGLFAVAVLGGLVGCRTQLQLHPRSEAKVVYVGEKSCSVYDFASATDVPEGSRNLGWVTVKSTGDDEATFVMLRQKICEMGGDALSQPAWVREANEHEPSLLKANAWVLP